MKKVRFNLVPTIHYLIVWNYAHRQARDGSEWIRMAVDRYRFRRRILEFDKMYKLICMNKIYTTNEVSMRSIESTTSI